MKKDAAPRLRRPLFIFVVVFSMAEIFADVLAAVLKASETKLAATSSNLSVSTVLTDDAGAAADDNDHLVAATLSVRAG